MKKILMLFLVFFLNFYLVTKPFPGLVSRLNVIIPNPREAVISTVIELRDTNLLRGI